MLIKIALNKESSYEISLKLDYKFSRGISYSSQIVFLQFLHKTCFSSAICPLQVPVLAIQISFSSILNALSYEINLFSRCSSLLNIDQIPRGHMTAASLLVYHRRYM